MITSPDQLCQESTVKFATTSNIQSFVFHIVESEFQIIEFYEGNET